MELGNTICMGTMMIAALILGNLSLMREGTWFGRQVFWTSKEFLWLTASEVMMIVVTIVLYEILVPSGAVSDYHFFLILIATLIIMVLVGVVLNVIRAKRPKEERN